MTQYHQQIGATDCSQQIPKTKALPRIAFGPMEASAVLGVSWDFFREHIDPELRWVRRGRKKLVSLRELEAWLERSAARTSGR